VVGAVEPALLSAGLVVDASDRARSGIRITLKDGRLQRAPLPLRAVDCGGTLDGATALRDLEFAVVDVETTGGSFHRGHRVTEIAAVRMSGTGVLLDECRTLINPERPIPPFITSLTSISWEMVRHAPRFHEVAGEVGRVLGGAVVVAHNAAFDWRFVCAELDRAGVPLTGRTLCTVQFARRVVPEVRSRSLDSLAHFFNIHNYARHRAWGDALATAELLRRLLDRAEDRDVRAWADLELLLRKRARKRRRPAAANAPQEMPGHE
jgi:DNA polymerase III subunit epsilon